MVVILFVVYAEVSSRGRNFSVHIPKIFPALPGFPQEYLALDEAAILVNRGDLAHFIGAQRFAEHRVEIGIVVCGLNRKWDWSLPSLDRPPEANARRVNA